MGIVSRKLLDRSSSSRLDRPETKTPVTSWSQDRSLLTDETGGVQLGDLVLGQDEPHQPRHVGEGPRLDVRDQVVGDVDREQLGLAGKHQGSQGI